MKKLNLIFSLGAVMAGVLAAGCSKAPEGTAAKAVSKQPVSTDSSGPVELKAKWTVGKRYDQEMTMKQQMHLAMPNMPKPMDMNMTMGMGYSLAALKDLPEGGTEVELTMTAFKIDSVANGKSQMSFDSSQDPQPGENPATAPFRKMIGGHVKYDTDADGKVTKVIGMEEFTAQMSGGNPQSAALVKSFMNEDTLKQIAMRGQGLPDHPVQVGDHWPYHLELATGQAGTVKMDVKYVFKGWQQLDGHKCALLEFVGDMASLPGSGTGPMNVAIEKGRITGDTWFDPEQAMVVQSIMDEPMTLKMVMQGKSISTEMKQTITIKVAEAADVPK